MDKQEHGGRLAAAVGAKQLSRQEVADAVGRETRAVTNWTTGYSMPTEREREILRTLVGPYDSYSDPVDAAVLQSELTEDRQYAVLAFYKRLLREQNESPSEWPQSDFDL